LLLSESESATGEGDRYRVLPKVNGDGTGPVKVGLVLLAVALAGEDLVVA